MYKMTEDPEFKSLLIDTAELTETNCHGEALEEVAAFFRDVQLANAFNAINTLHLTIGYLDSPIAELRKRFSDMLFERIERKHGEEIRKAVYNCL